MLLRMREQVCDHHHHHHHHHHQLPDLSSPVLTSQGSASAELLEEFVNQTAGQAFNRLMAGLRGSALGLFCK